MMKWFANLTTTQHATLPQIKKNQRFGGKQKKNSPWCNLIMENKTHKTTYWATTLSLLSLIENMAAILKTRNKNTLYHPGQYIQFLFRKKKKTLMNHTRMIKHQ